MTMPIQDINKQRKATEAAQKRAALHSIKLPPTETLSAIIEGARLDFRLKHIKGVNRADTLVKTGEITVVCVSQIDSVQTLHDALAALTRDGFAFWIPSSSQSGFSETIRFSSWDIEFAISDELRAQERFENAVAVCKATFEIPYTYREPLFAVSVSDDDNRVFEIVKVTNKGESSYE